MRSIFISSTFRDMHFERDILNKNIGPKLNYALSTYNTQIRITDLRWGVDTSELSEEEATARVLKVCFDEIENCKPYIMVLLGDRYGYIPDGSDISVTNMEILRGVLENAEPEHVFIYFRETDYTDMPTELRNIFCESSPKNTKRLAELKERLRREFPDQCRTYHAVWSEEAGMPISADFEEMVRKDLEERFIADLATAQYRSPLEKQLCENEEILSDNIKYAYSDEALIQEHLKILHTAEEPVAIIGQAGAGKSVYMSLLCSAVRRESHMAHILFCGDNAFSSSVRNVAECVLYALTVSSDMEYDFEGFSCHSYDELIRDIMARRMTVKTKSYLFIDAVDQSERGLLPFLMWCRNFLKGCLAIIFSSRETEELTALSQSLILSSLVYEHNDYLAMTDCILKKNGKSLSSAIVELICRKAETPLWLGLLVQRLINLRARDFDEIQKAGGGIDAINAYLTQAIEQSGASIEEAVFLHIGTLLDESVDRDFYLILVGLITHAEHGLTETMLQAICQMLKQPWVELDFTSFMSAFSFYIRVRENGRLDISHDVLRQVLLNILSPNRKLFCAAVAEYYMGDARLDEVSVSAFFSAVRLGEMRELCARFIIKNHHMFASMDPHEALIAREIRTCIFRHFMYDEGRFVLSCMLTCQDANDIAFYHSCVASALMSVNNYIEPEIAIKLARTVMVMPLKLPQLPPEVAEMQLDACTGFLRRHLREGSPELASFLKEMAGAIVEKRRRERSNEQISIADPFDTLRDPTIDKTEKIPFFTRLAQQGRSLAHHPDTVQKAESLLLELLTIQQTYKVIENKDMLDILYADIYTSLGEAYKTMERWDDAVRYDELSLNIYRDRYERNPTPDMFRKYRERVYNTANVVEAWAMHEGEDQDLLEETCRRYRLVYELELVAIAAGIPEKELLLSAGSILSYGTALIHTGQREVGAEKYREGIDLIRKLAEAHKRPEILIQFSTHLLECIYNLIYSGEYDMAHGLVSDIQSVIKAAVGMDADACQNKLSELTIAFSNFTSKCLTGLFQAEDFLKAIALSEVLRDIYVSIIPFSPHAVKVNLLITLKNIADICYLKLEDKKRALAEYRNAFVLIEQCGLTDPDESGHYTETINLHMTDLYIRMIDCLDAFPETRDEIKTMLERAQEFAAYQAEHTERLKGDAPYVLYTIGLNLIKKYEKKELGILFLMMAFNLTQDDGYDFKTHAHTVKEILRALSEHVPTDGNGEQ